MDTDMRLNALAGFCESDGVDVFGIHTTLLVLRTEQATFIIYFVPCTLNHPALYGSIHLVACPMSMPHRNEGWISRIWPC